MEHSNDPETDYGYGYLHLKPVSEQYFTDQDSGTSYNVECGYRGAKKNLYNDGANSVIESLEIKIDYDEVNAHIY